MHKKVNFRSNRLASEIKRVLSEYLLVESFDGEEIDPKQILITEVVVSPDLRYAKIFVEHLRDHQLNDLCVEFMEKYHGKLRHHIAESIPLRYVPEIAIHEDTSEVYAANIDRLIKIANQRTSETE